MLSSRWPCPYPKPQVDPRHIGISPVAGAGVPVATTKSVIIYATYLASNFLLLLIGYDRVRGQTISFCLVRRRSGQNIVTCLNLSYGVKVPTDVRLYVGLGHKDG